MLEREILTFSNFQNWNGYVQGVDSRSRKQTITETIEKYKKYFEYKFKTPSNKMLQNWIQLHFKNS